jgi:hypothetical protein
MFGTGHGLKGIKVIGRLNMPFPSSIGQEKTIFKWNVAN